jgi:ankyrin repeat protein
MYTAVGGHVEFARMLLERGALIDAPGGYIGQTALHRAVAWHKIQVARLLLEHGADLNARDECGRTPSQVVTETLGYGSDEIVELLSAYGDEP